MKQTISALLLALTLLLGLTGCTAKKDNGSNDNGILGDNSTQNGGNVDNGTNNGNGTINGNGSLNGNTGNGTMNGGTNNSNGTTNGSTNNGSANNNDGEGILQGRSYEEMLRNGRVHDEDGILTDGENSVSDWN